jgi:hypothetical protein
MERKEAMESELRDLALSVGLDLIILPSREAFPLGFFPRESRQQNATDVFKEIMKDVVEVEKQTFYLYVTTDSVFWTSHVKGISFTENFIDK